MPNIRMLQLSVNLLKSQIYNLTNCIPIYILLKLIKSFGISCTKNKIKVKIKTTVVISNKQFTYTGISPQKYIRQRNIDFIL